MDKDGDGFIEEREWVPPIRTLIAFHQLPNRIPGSRDMRRYFPFIDKNGDDKIARTEFESLLRHGGFLFFAERYLYCNALPSDFCETVNPGNTTTDVPIARSDTHSASIATSPKTSASGNKAMMFIKLFNMLMIAQQCS